MFKRPPDRIIGDNYLQRWHVIPRNRFFNIYLHKYLGSDDDRALHDHPWWSMSIKVKGELFEVVDCDGDQMVYRIASWLPKFRRPEYAHRLILRTPSALTLFFTGPAIRPWGFHCPKGWVPWRQFTDESGDRIGRGCE